MARIAGVNIPTNKRVEIALTYIHGIGRTTAKKIIAKLGIAPKSASRTSPTRKCSTSARRSTATTGRRRPSPRNRDEHQAADGPRLLPRAPPPPRPAGPRPAHAHQRAHPQGQGPADRGQEEVTLADFSAWRITQPFDSSGRTELGIVEVNGPSTPAHPQKGAQEHHRRRRSCERQLQQYDDHHHRRSGQRDRVELGRDDGLQGQPKVDALCRAGRGGGRRQEGRGPRRPHARGRGQGPGSGRESALRALQAVGFTITSHP